MSADAKGAKQTLFLWRLLAVGDDFFGDIRPEISAAERKELAATGLIEIEKRDRSKPGKRKTQAMFVKLTDRGWEWAAAHLDAEIMVSKFSSSILQAFLTKTKAFLHRRDIALAELMTDVQRPIDALPADSNGHVTVDFAIRVREAYQHLSNGRWSTQVRLSDLRRELADLPRATVDQGLLEMEAARRLVLYPLDDPRQIGPADEEAALTNSVGRPRHVVHIDHSS